MLYPKTQTIRQVANATNREPEDIYRLLDSMGLRAPVGRQVLEGFFAQTLVARAIPVTDYGVSYG